MDFEITPQPTEAERAAIEAALRKEVQSERSSAWADALLPQRADDPEPDQGP
jgi:hypothetical protein